MKKINNHTRTEISRFIPSTGICEYHAIIHITRPELTFDQQLSALLDAYDYLLKHEANGAKAVFKRFFLSDAANQTDLLLATLPENTACACSIVEQPPLDGTKIALWVYLQTDVIPQPFPGRLTGFSHNGYTHLWTGSRIQYGESSEHQTRLLLNDYLLQLMENGGTLAANCLRTWFFVQNVDVNYAGVVKARNEVFHTQNLTPETHFIASTGIGGRHADPKVTVLMDAYPYWASRQNRSATFMPVHTSTRPTNTVSVSNGEPVWITVTVAIPLSPVQPVSTIGDRLFIPEMSANKPSACGKM